MKDTKIALIVIALIFLFYDVYSNSIEITQARKVAVNFYAEKGSIPVQQLFLINEQPLFYENTVVAYVFNLHNGFIMVSAHKAAFPVIAYSFESEFSNSDFPIALESWLKHYFMQIKFAVDQNKNPDKTQLNLWSRYSEEDFFPKEIKEEVKPLLYTTWHQGCYYNSYFPLEATGPCGHLWTGCVATAMGQIMKYYNFPKSGTGSYGYNSSYGYVGADFGNTAYDWIGMDYHLTSVDNAVAELLFHCAISIHSQFFPNGTGAYDFNVRNALVNYFNYSPDAQFYWRDNYAGDWKTMLRSELNAGRPVLYGGADSQTNTGHTLVCDGYQDTTFFHFNWGWNGIYNGYYYLDSLVAGSHYFDFQHDAVVGIKPEIPGSIQIYPPVNLTASINSSIVNLNWEAPVIYGNLEFLGYNVFRNGFILNTQIFTETEFPDETTTAGWQHYKVSSVFIGGETCMNETLDVFIEGNAIKENFNSNIAIYPVPAYDYFFVDANEPGMKNYLLSILDLNGNIVFEQQYICNGNSISKVMVPHHLKGIYIIKIQNKASSYFFKQVIY